tara:strand:+ start:96 stop:833 length:738 start_codon:yes stop_codon:yes gene_type:complete
MDFTLLLIIFTLFSGLLLFISKFSNQKTHHLSFIEFFGSLFPILFIVLFVRSFIIEPYKIPSGSMLPTLLIGDFILVKKYEYGVRIPIINSVIIDYNKPDYSDVVVFQYPQNKNINYIKRVVALPGDKVEYINKEIFINGKRFRQSPLIGNLSTSEYDTNSVYKEISFTKSYKVLKNSSPPQNFSYIVPANSYFVLGDNRDNSNDSRYWGPVPFENIIGKAFYIWMYWNPSSTHSILDRAGTSIE